MRNTNSREKPSTSSYSQQQSNNRLMKTQLPPKAGNKQSLNSTEYKLPPNQTSIKRIQSTKSSSSSSNNNPIPRQQRNYDIQNNMTQSKLITAKESLQLLKKKMNRTGMSRQKPTNTPQSNQNIPIQPISSSNADSMKKIKSDSNKYIQPFQPSTTKYSSHSSKNYQQQQQSYSSKDTYEPQSYKAPVKKPVQQRQKPQIQKPQMKKTTSISQDYYNEAQQVPIATKKQSFQAMIEKQLRKQQQAKNLSNNPSNSYQRNQPKAQMNEYPDDDGGELFQCSKGCGRQFNANVLSKHQKICEKVFQQKRKVFNTAAQRQIENQGGFQKPSQPVNNKFNQTKKPAEKKSSKVPKWKLQSAQLRAGLKALNNTPLTKQQEALTKMQSDDLVPCNYCGRKFNQTAAARHIPVCANKAKQVNRAPVAKKR